MSRMDTQPDLSLIIVSWNVAALLEACLRSIYANAGSLALEVIVVDSASTDDSVARVQAAYPQVRLLTQTENIGFTRGNNIGLDAARGRLIMLLNPDTEIVANALPTLARYLDEHPAVGIVGPHTLNSDGTTQPTKRRFPTLRTGIFESTCLQRYAPRRMLDRFYTNDIPPDATAEVDWMQGSALMFRHEVYHQVGALDERYVMYSEEVDFCKRAKDRGWQVVYLGAARIVHHGGQSTAQANARSHIHFQQSKLVYFRKHHGRRAAGILRAVIILNYVWQLAEEWLKGILGSKRELRRERVRVYRQVLRSLVRTV